MESIFRKMGIFKVRSFIVEERDVTKILSIMKGKANIKSIARCGWGQEPTKWQILFVSSNGDYDKIITSILNIGQIEIKSSPNNKINYKYIILK